MRVECPKPEIRGTATSTFDNETIARRLAVLALANRTDTAAREEIAFLEKLLRDLVAAK